jgi:hypothetical protein
MTSRFATVAAPLLARPAPRLGDDHAQPEWWVAPWPSPARHTSARHLGVSPAGVLPDPDGFGILPRSPELEADGPKSAPVKLCCPVDRVGRE